MVVFYGTFYVNNKSVYDNLPFRAQGWGSSKHEKLAKSETRDFLAQFIEQEHLDRPIIVSPSMSGGFAIPYLMTPTPQTCQDRARGFVPLAPVQTEAYSHSQYHRCEVRDVNAVIFGFLL